MLKCSTSSTKTLTANTEFYGNADLQMTPRQNNALNGLSDKSNELFREQKPKGIELIAKMVGFNRSRVLDAVSTEFLWHFDALFYDSTFFADVFTYFVFVKLELVRMRRLNWWRCE